MSKSPDQLEQEVERMVQFGIELRPYWIRYQTYVQESGSIYPTSPAHPSRMHETGLRCRRIRNHCSLPRDFVAEQLGVPPVQLAAFEGGLIPPVDLPEGFAQNLSEILRRGLETKTSQQK